MALGDDSHSDTDSETEELPSPKISHKAAAEAFRLCCTYLEQQEDTASVQLMLLNQLKTTAEKKHFTSVKQSDFFKPQ